MLSALLNSLRAIIDLLIKRQESQKTRIDIELAKKSLEDKSRLVTPASFEDVRRYDPRVSELERRVKPAPMRRVVHKGPVWVVLPVALLVAALLAAVAFLMRR